MKYFHQQDPVRWSAKEVQEYHLIDEKYFPEGDGYDMVEMDMTYEDKMKIEAEIDKLDGDFYRDPQRLDGTIREKNYVTLPVR